MVKLVRISWFKITLKVLKIIKTDQKSVKISKIVKNL